MEKTSFRKVCKSRLALIWYDVLTYMYYITLQLNDNICTNLYRFKKKINNRNNLCSCKKEKKFDLQLTFKISRRNTLTKPLNRVHHLKINNMCKIFF